MGKRAGCFALFVFLVFRGYCVALPHHDTGLSAVCDCGISRSYSLTILMTKGSLMKVEKYCRMFPLKHSVILLTCIKHQSVLKTTFGLLLSDRLRQVLLYVKNERE